MLKLFDFLIYGDIPYTSVKLSRLDVFSLWSQESLGTVSRQSLGGLRDFLFLLVSFDDRVFYFLKYLLPILLIPVVYFYVFTKFGIKHFGLKIALSIFPLFTPVFLGDYLTGQTFWVYLTLPFVVLFIYRMYYLSEINFQNSILLSLSLFLTFGFLPPIIVPLIPLLILLILPAFVVQIKNWHYMKRALAYSVISACIFALLVFPFLITAPSGQQAFKSPTALNDYYHNYSQTKFINTLRLAGNAGSGQQTLGYNHLSVTNLFGYVFLIAILLGLIRFRREGTFFKVLLSAFLAITGLMHLLSANGELGSYIFNSQWIVTSIRNPTKIYVVMLPVFMLLLGSSLDAIFQDLNRSYLRKMVLAGFVVCLAIYGWPTLRGDFGLFYGKNLTSQDYRPDPVIAEIVEAANKSPGRSLIIPADHKDELNFQNVSYKLNSIRLSGNLPKTGILTRNIIYSFNNQNSIFRDYLFSSNISNVFIKKNNRQRDPFAIFPTNLGFDEAKDFLIKNGFTISKETEDYAHLTIQTKPFVYSPSQINNVASEIDFDSIAALNRQESTVTLNSPGAYKNVVNNYSANTEPGQGNQTAVLFDPTLITVSITNQGQGRWIVEGQNLDGESYLINQFKVDPESGSILVDRQALELVNNRVKVNIRSGRHSLDFVKSNQVEIGAFDPSFESDSKPGDASAGRKGDPGIYAGESADKTEGSKSLLLGSSNHKAYVEKKFPELQIGKLYKISFDYKHIKGANPPSFALWQADSGMAWPRGELNNANDWTAFQMYYWHTEGAGPVSLYLYANATEESVSEDLFDNVRLYEVESTDKKEFEIESNPPYMQVGNTDIFSSVNSENLLSNGNFENPGLWGGVGDASEGAPGKAAVFARQSLESVEGKRSLSLESFNHTAYVSQPIKNFDPNAVYKISFYYKNAAGSMPSFAVWQSGANKSFPSKTFAETGDWVYYENFFVPDHGATGLSVYLYSPARNSQTVNLFDDVKLEKVPFIKNYLTLQSPNASDPGNLVQGFERASPSLAVVDLAHTNSPGLVVVSESYHEGWKAFLKPKNQEHISLVGILTLRPRGIELPAENHVLVDGYANGWWVDQSKYPSGDYDLVLEFWPQRYMYIGLVIAGAVLIFCFCSLFYIRHNRRMLV